MCPDNQPWNRESVMITLLLSATAIIPGQMEDGGECFAPWGRSLGSCSAKPIMSVVLLILNPRSDHPVQAQVYSGHSNAMVKNNIYNSDTQQHTLMSSIASVLYYYRRNIIIVHSMPYHITLIAPRTSSRYIALLSSQPIVHLQSWYWDLRSSSSNVCSRQLSSTQAALTRRGNRLNELILCLKDLI